MKITLKAARVNKGYYQEEAAKLIGISCSTLASYEQGNTYPNIKIIKKIEEVYGVDSSDLIFLPNNDA